MPEIDVVVDKLSITKEATFEIDKLYEFMRDWFNRKNYDFYEKDYGEKLKAEGFKDNKIKWKTERKVDDYIKFTIKVTIKCSDIKEVRLKKCIACKGKLTISLKSELQVDYDDRWKSPSFLKFTRGIFDKFIMKDRYVRYNTELKDETYDLFNQIKAFLNLQKL